MVGCCTVGGLLINSSDVLLADPRGSRWFSPVLSVTELCFLVQAWQ